MENGWRKPAGEGLNAAAKIADSMEKKHAGAAWAPDA
jgi:hypothetical protein